MNELLTAFAIFLLILFAGLTVIAAVVLYGLAQLVIFMWKVLVTFLKSFVKATASVCR